MKGITEKEKGAILEAVLEASYDGIAVLDNKGYSIYVNNACERIEGATAEEVMSKNIRQLVEEGVYSESVTLKVLETKTPTTIIQYTKNGNEVLVTGTPIFNVDGSVDKVVVNSRDITELNGLKKELKIKEELAKKYQIEIERLRLESKDYGNVVCKSREMQKILKLALSLSKVNSTVLITGESGVGKGVLANFIHSNSERRDCPYITIDCSAIPEYLIESELFGYDEGAFTGANKGGKTGLVQLADKGTLVLDEISELSYSMQSKLLRLIQEKVFYRVGGEKAISVDIRVIAMTNQDLVEMVNQKLFRKDLYYRLNVIPVYIPPLRDRKEDIIPLAEKFLDNINAKNKIDKRLEKSVYQAFLDHKWPGNVRELENIVERLVVICDGDIVTKDDLPREIVEKNEGITFDIAEEGSYKTLAEAFEQKIFEEYVNKYGSINKISEVLGIDRSTVRKKIKKYQLKT